EGEERSNAILKNHGSVINSWIKFRQGVAGAPQAEASGDLLALGEEVGVRFLTELDEYLDDQKVQKKKKSTIADRKYIMWLVRESASELIKQDGLPEGFAEALCYLVENSGMTSLAITEAVAMDLSTLRKWRLGRTLPFLSSLPTIERLEELFRLQPGALSNRLPHISIVFGNSRPRTCTTPWRAHHRLLQQFPYNLRELPLAVEADFGDLVRFKTDDVWVEQQGLVCDSEWRIRQNRGTTPTANVFYRATKCFLSFLHLPPDADHLWLRGKGFSLQSLTLALCGDADLVLAYAEFMRERSYSRCFNTGVVTFIAHCKTLLKPETGFLRQQPRYGSLLPTPVPADEWDAWCEANRQRMLKFLKVLKKSKNRPLKLSRDPFDAVRNIIEGRQRPISALMEMAASMKLLIPWQEKYKPKRFHILMRDIAFAELITSFPMRIENFSMLTWIPTDPADFITCDKDYVETTADSNLYQKPDGGWWLRFKPWEIKNAKGIDVPVVDSVLPSLKEYLFRHRPVLNLELKRAIIRRRAQKNLPALTPAEERAIDLCPYVFRPSIIYVYRTFPAKLAGCKGVEQMDSNSLSYLVFKLSQKYIADCKGFRAHAVRHIVASEYIKNYPNGYAVAAAALNITEAVVRKHYAWVRPCDQIKPWQEYHESLRRQFDGEASPV
ncbi:MAG: hypothetical protein LC802_10870, partial [Acidobacteria bacterium]|nr:hypothetical protein [Acidobacteriota bacterium]